MKNVCSPERLSNMARADWSYFAIATVLPVPPEAKGCNVLSAKNAAVCQFCAETNKMNRSNEHRPKKDHNKADYEKNDWHDFTASNMEDSQPTGQSAPTAGHSRVFLVYYIAIQS